MLFGADTQNQRRHPAFPCQRCGQPARCRRHGSLTAQPHRWQPGGSSGSSSSRVAAVAAFQFQFDYARNNLECRLNLCCRAADSAQPDRRHICTRNNTLTREAAAAAPGARLGLLLAMVLLSTATSIVLPAFELKRPMCNPPTCGDVTHTEASCPYSGHQKERPRVACATCRDSVLKCAE